MKINILLTGASGNVGREILAQLIAQKEKFNIVVFDLENRKSKKIFSKYAKDIQIVYGDLTQVEDINKIPFKPDVVLHLAALIPPAAYKNKSLTHKINYGGTKNLINFLKEKAPETFLVYSSSVAVYGDRLENPHIKVGDLLIPSKGDFYAEAKIEAEKIIQNSGLDFTIFRLSAIMGVGNHKMSEIMFLMPLKTPMEITTPKDTARAFVNSIQHKDELKGKIFNLGGGTENRIIYEDFLQRNFSIQGLANMEFPPKSFAERNYHCGYYADGDDLEQILDFRRDTIDSYFEQVEESVPSWKRVMATINKPLVKKILLSKSAPLKAFNSKDEESMGYYF